MQLEGLHHVTAITGDASLNVAFYTQVLGLHLVKKTVNQDDVSAYHLFYGDDTGNPGTELTFFDWPMAGPQRPGAGTISTIALGVNGREALEWWVQRFESFKVPHEGIQLRGDNEKAVVAFRDPEGQRLEPRFTWTCVLTYFLVVQVSEVCITSHFALPTMRNNCNGESRSPGRSAR